RPSGDSSSASASARCPARARCSTAATALAVITLTVPPGRVTETTSRSAASGSSTYSRTLCTRTRCALASGSRSPRSRVSPWTAFTRTPASAARRSRAASESGLGSTTVTRCPSSASGTAAPPVPPPASTISRGAADSSAARANSAVSASQTTAVRAALEARRGPTVEESTMRVLSPPRVPGATLQRQRCLVLHQAGEQAVDEDGRLVGGQFLGHRHRLRDRHPVGDVLGPQQLVGADPQDVAVHHRHALQRPADGVGLQQFVDPFAVLLHPGGEPLGELVDRRLGLRPAALDHFGDGDTADLGLVEHFDRTQPGLVP